MYFLKCECVAISGLLEPLTFSNFVFNIFILLRVFIIHTTRTHSYVPAHHSLWKNSELPTRRCNFSKSEFDIRSISIIPDWQKSFKRKILLHVRVEVKLYSYYLVRGDSLIVIDIRRSDKRSSLRIPCE